MSYIVYARAHNLDGSVPPFLKRLLPGGDLRLGAAVRFREALASPAC